MFSGTFNLCKYAVSIFGLPAEAAQFNNIAILEAVGKKKVPIRMLMIVAVSERTHERVVRMSGHPAQEAASSVAVQQLLGRLPDGCRAGGSAEYNV